MSAASRFLQVCTAITLLAREICVITCLCSCWNRGEISGERESMLSFIRGIWDLIEE